MLYRLINETTLSAGIALAMSGQPGAGVLVLSGDELARVSGGDSPITSTTDSTLNRARASERQAALEDAYLRS